MKSKNIELSSGEKAHDCKQVENHHHLWQRQKSWPVAEGAHPSRPHRRTQDLTEKPPDTAKLVSIMFTTDVDKYSKPKQNTLHHIGTFTNAYSLNASSRSSSEAPIGQPPLSGYAGFDYCKWCNPIYCISCNKKTLSNVTLTIQPLSKHHGNS